MSERKKGTTVFLCLGVLIAAAVMSLEWLSEVPFLHKLCDALFVPGVVLFCMGALKYFRNKGAFDMMAYGISHVFYTAFPALRGTRSEEIEHEDYYAYTQRKQGERKPAGDILIAGGIFLVLSLVALIAYYVTEG